MSRTRVFISYARPTAARAREIAAAFGSDVDVWIDDQLLAHRSFTDAIEEQIKAADAVVAVWSAEAVKSDWVRAEASRAREMGKLVQVRIDDCDLPMPYDQIHCIDLSGWGGEPHAPAWRAVLASISAASGRTAASPSAGAATGPRGAAERRQLTALACRVAEPAGQPLDPEDLMALIEACAELCERVIPQHGGTVADRLDRGVLAYFGYPQGHEDAEADAVRAALALTAAAAGGEAPSGVPLVLQAGVATGQVVVSGADLAQATVVGDTPAQAAQLAAQAPPGGVLVAAATRRLTQELFEYSDTEGGSGAGLALEAKDAAGAPQPPRGGVLFGREGDVQTLRDCWENARRGAGQVVLVEGEAGVGKSALVAAFRHEATGVPAMVWHCGSAHAARPLHPAAEALEREAGFVRGDSAQTRREKLAALLDRWGVDTAHGLELLGDLVGISAPQPGAAGLEPDRRRALTIDLLLGLMERRAADGGALFLVEDLQWADPTTLDLLDRAVQQAADRHWMIVATARPEFQCGWFEHSDVAHIRLGALPAFDAQRICGALDAERRLDEATVHRIVARAEGVPLFVEEITRSVLEGLAAGDTGRAQVPSSLQGSLVARLDRLGPAKATARIGAAIGRGFTYEQIEAVAGQPPAELRQALRDLVRAGLLDCTGTPPASRYSFRHGLICDAAYETLPRRQREALHLKIAEALAGSQGAAPADPGLIADHLARGGAAGQAVPLWAAAGQQAAAKAAHGEAAHYLEAALRQLRAGAREPGDVGLELQLLIGLAVSQAATRGYTAREVGKALMEARAICDALGNVADLFPVLRGICAFMIVAGDMDAAEQTARRCLEIGLETGRPEQRIEGECPLGYVLWCKGELAEARKHLEAAAALYVEHDGAKLPPVTPQDPLIQSLGPLQVICHAQGDEAAAERASRDLLAHAATLGESFSGAFGVFWRGFYAQVAGDFPTALKYAGEASASCVAHGYTGLALQAEITRICAMGSLGDPNAALAAAAPVMAEIDRRGEVHALAFKLGEIAALHAAAGELPQALTAVDAAIASAKATGERFWLPSLERRRADIVARTPASAPA